MGGAALQALLDDEECERRAAAIARMIEGRGSITEAVLRRADEMKAPGLFGLCRGIDDAFRGIHPLYSKRTRHKLDDHRNRHEERGRYNSSPSRGAVLPRFSLPARPARTPEVLADCFGVLLRVGPTEWQKIRHRRVRRNYDIPRSLALPGLEFACVPMLADLEDVVLEPVEGAEEHYYSLAPNNTGGRIEGRIREVVKRLDRSGATIAVLPEGALDRSLLEHWQKVLASEPIAKRSHLHWILAGTGPVNGTRHENTAVLLHRDGSELMRQPKRFGFTFSPTQLKDWKLVEVLGSQTLSEYVAELSPLTVLESSVGRFAILVCEDAGRLVDSGSALRSAGISIAMVPIFSKAIADAGWEQRATDPLVTEVGTQFIVANSLVIPTHSAWKGDVCAVAGPGKEFGSHRSRFETKPSSGDPLEPICLKLDPVVTLPSYRDLAR